MPALVVPGVRVEARFDVLPPLPAPSGIVGVAGIVDRPPADSSLVGVTRVAELRELLGPGTPVSMPQAAHALTNGASEVLVAAVGGGRAATATLRNAASTDAVLLRCRSNGAWGNRLRIEVREIRGPVPAGGGVAPIARVGLRLLDGNRVVESFPDLRFAAGVPDDLFETINTRSAHVIAVDPNRISARPGNLEHNFDDDGTPVELNSTGANPRPLLRLAPAEGASPSGLRVEIDSASGVIRRLDVLQNGLQEHFADLTLDPDSDDYLPIVLLTRSRLVRAVPLVAEDAALPAAAGGPVAFSGGESPTVDDYVAAIERLADDPRIDLCMVSVEPERDVADVRRIHQALVAHAVTMADAGAPRIAFGSVTAQEQTAPAAIQEHAALVRDRRFVLVAPAGAEGAVAGMIGRLNPQESPTFKNVPLAGIAPAAYRESELNRLLGPSVNLLVVQDRRGRGVVVLKGIDTTGDQLSVTRVADQAIRETKAIAEGYIGQLNTDTARIALKQQIVATFTRMERAGALVPSTDGTDRAFLVDVYSTQQDFAQGIVRIDIAVRPVRAIDYVYATIRVKN